LIEGNAAEHSRRDSASANARCSYRRSVWRCLHGVLLCLFPLDSKWSALREAQSDRSGSINDATRVCSRFHHLTLIGFRFPHATASLCQETGADESRLCNASSLAFMPHVPSTLRAARWGNHRISTYHASVRRQLEASVKRQSTQRPSKSPRISCSGPGAETSAPAMSGHSCYNQPDRLKPTHSAPHNAAIPSRVAS
jgi:hypothetical protein